MQQVGDNHYPLIAHRCTNWPHVRRDAFTAILYNLTRFKLVAKAVDNRKLAQGIRPVRITGLKSSPVAVVAERRFGGKPSHTPGRLSCALALGILRPIEPLVRNTLLGGHLLRRSLPAMNPVQR